MKIQRAEIVAMFNAVGFHTAGRWTNDKLTTKVATLPKLLAGSDVKIEDEKAQATLTKVLAVLKEGKEQIKVVGEEPKAETKKTAKAEGKKGKKGKKAKGEGKAKAAKIETNKFGYRVGTNSDAVDKCLGKKAMTVDQLVKASKQSKAFVTMHLKHAITNERGVKKTDKGYVATV